MNAQAQSNIITGGLGGPDSPEACPLVVPALCDYQGDIVLLFTRAKQANVIQDR
jgi:hypothetical protein